jgi:hypothetical protein
VSDRQIEHVRMTLYKHRSLARPFFERDRVADPVHFERHTNRLNSLLRSLSGIDGHSFDIQVSQEALKADRVQAEVACRMFSVATQWISSRVRFLSLLTHLERSRILSSDFLFGLTPRTMVSPELITKESADLMFAFNELQKAASTRIRMSVHLSVDKI